MALPPILGAPGPSHLGTGDSTNSDPSLSPHHKIGCPILNAHCAFRVGRHEPKSTRFVSGHDFSCAAKGRKGISGP